MENISIHMVRSHLENLPPCNFPKPYAIRTYQPGDERAWKDIHLRADRYNTFTDETFGKQFGADTRLLEENQFYLINAEEQPVGTATAWCVARGEPAREEGLVHWVALIPEEQGKGLSKPLLAAVCHRLKVRGYTRAYLSTSSARIAAVGLYLSFGFQPDIRQAVQRDIWLRLRNALGARGHLIRGV